MDSPILWNVLKAMPENREFEAYHYSHSFWRSAEFHSHEFYEFYFFITGDGRFVLESYEYPLSPRSLIVIPPGYMHRLVTRDSNAYYERFYLYASTDCLKHMSDKALDLLAFFVELVKRSRFYFPLGEQSFAACTELVDEITKASSDASPAGQHINRCRVNMLLGMMCRAIAEDSAGQEMLPTSRIGGIIEYINQNLSERLTLDGLAERFYLNKYYMLHEFKQHTSTSLYGYIQQKRIIYAKLLLQSGVKPGDVCARCGFADYTSFYRAFKRDTRLSPREYADRMKG